MSSNLVSMVITAQQKTTVLAAIQSLETNLAGLISLEPKDRRRLIGLGDKNDAFARATIRVLGANSAVVPAGLNVAGAQADLVALDQLLPIADALQRMNSRMQDTLAGLGHDVMVVALDGYGMLKYIGASQGLEELRKDIGTRFYRSRKRTDEDGEGEEEETSREVL